MEKNIIERIIHPTAKGKIWQAFILVLLLLIAGLLVDIGQYYNKGVDWLSTKTNKTVVLPKTKEIPFRLGLDLQGGTHLVYKADVSAISEAEQDASVEGARDVIERRVNYFGVSEPLVQIDKNISGDYKIIVELAGVKDVNEAIKMIGETPLLEFKEQAGEQRALTTEEQKSLDDYNKHAEKKATDILGKALSGGDFSALAKNFSEDGETKDKGGDLGWLTENSSSILVGAVKNIKNGEVAKDFVQAEKGLEILKLEDKRIKKSSFNDQEEQEIKASHILICYKGAQNCSGELSKEDALKKIKELKTKVNAGNFNDLSRENSTEPAAKQTGGDLGWFGKGVMDSNFENSAFKLAKGSISDAVETPFGYHLIYKQDERPLYEYKIAHILVKTKSKVDIVGPTEEWKVTELTGKYLDKASVNFNPNDGSPEVALKFDSEGAKLFEDITGRNIGKPVAIYLDNYPISAPTVNDKISGGEAVITGRFSLQEAKLLAQRLNEGALPVPVSLVSQQTIGASLGGKSVSDSVRAGLYGFLLVAIFMMVFYRLPGLVSIFALAIYSIIVLAIFKLWPVTLTLSGLAGFILSIGMAVDANILIFARIREELLSGKIFSIALEDGFKRAWPSIRDSNISTLITCFILSQFSASIIKGFAITLAIGVIVSMFSAIIITKNLLKLISGRYLDKHKWLFGAKN
jgi:protein-export membrane protein SecD